VKVGATVQAVANAAEPVVGWKIWRVEHTDERTRLHSVLYGSLWPPGRPAVADCKKLYRARHEAPDPLCECGIHGAKSLEQWRHYLAVGGDRVFGQVLLWGDRLEGELGWRAATGYPLALCVPAALDGAEAIAEGLSVYGVPVEIADAHARVREAVAA
jgi:hypothetical protein